MSNDQSSDIIVNLQKNGFFLSLNLGDLSGSLRTTHANHHQDEEIIRFFTSSDAIALIEEGLDNPFEKLTTLDSFQRLPKEVKDAIISISKDEKALEIYREGLLYILSKGNSNNSELRCYVYSQMLYAGPEHAEGGKQALKAAGSFLIGTLRGGGLYGGLIGLGGYLLSIW